MRILRVTSTRGLVSVSQAKVLGPPVTFPCLTWKRPSGGTSKIALQGFEESPPLYNGWKFS